MYWHYECHFILSRSRYFETLARGLQDVLSDEFCLLIDALNASKPDSWTFFRFFLNS
jgi:hypothetical protein